MSFLPCGIKKIDELKRKSVQANERDKEYYDIIILAKKEELKSVHFEYYQVNHDDIFYSYNEGTISDLKSTSYMPYFKHGGKTKEFYKENLPLYPVDLDLLAALVPQQKDFPFQTIEIKRLEEQFLENFRFSIKEIAPNFQPYLLSSVFYWLQDPINNVLHGSDSFVVPDNIRENPLSKYFIDYVPRSYSKPDRTKGNSAFFFKDFVVENLIEAISFSTLGIKQSYNLPSIRNSVSRAYSIHREENEFSKILNAFVRNKAFEKKEIKRFIDKYLEVFEIGSAVTIESDEGVSNRVYVLRDNQKILLADLGYGASQVVPIILQIGNVAFNSFDDYYGFQPSTIIIEEPETNLHPALQSRIADLLVSANKELNIQFIIETHSEYLIRKLQYLAAKTESGLEPEDTVIYYFHHPEKVPVGEKQVKKINIQQDGSLTDDFGTGFFDEADKIAISIWNMNKATKN